MLALKASEVAKSAMEQGQDCCEAMLTACSKVWNIELSDDIMAGASLLGEGMQSGCTCGALVGMVMASGILQSKYNYPSGKQVAKRLHQLFKNEFGSTCCRVIRKNRPVLQRIGKQACINLTARSAAIFVEEWEGIIGEQSSFNHHSNL